MRTSSICLSSLLLLASVSGCGSDETPPASTKVTVRRTAHGVPHITAPGFYALGAGIGYAQAQDTVCTLADQFLKVRGERARYLGRGPQDANVESDLTYRGLGLRARAEAAYDQQSPTMRMLLEGFAAGYNRYLEGTRAEALPVPCMGARWVKPIDGVDLLAYHLDLSLFDTLIPLLGYVAKAQPPAVSQGAQGPASYARPAFLRESELGSNGWAIGRERSSGGRGMLVANPHFPWEGGLRFYESHLTIPGELDVYGASLLGLPVINIGFNRDVAWTHTVTASSHFTLYRLKLAEGDPTAYLYDGEVRKMTGEEHTIDVLEADGSLSQVKRTFWRSHYGPLLSGPGAPWTNGMAYTLRDANEGNLLFAEHWLRMNQARGIDEVAEVERTVRGIPWVNTLVAGADGSTRYVDASRVPNLSAQTVDAYRASLAKDADTQLFASQRMVLLDGSTSRDEWVGLDGEARGLVPMDRAPQLSRSDFVMNANDSATYSNPSALLRNLPFPYEVYGTTQGRISPRTHMNLTLLTEQGETSAAGGDGRFTREELERALLGNRSWVAEQLLEPVVRRCQGATTVVVNGTPVDITEACRLLASWDGRLDLDRTGAVVWREFLGQFSRADLIDKGALFAEPFDPLQPTRTPSGLTPAPASGTDPVHQKLAEAVSLLGKAGIRVDARLGDVQFTRKGDRVIPISGGVGGLEGILNTVGFSAANTTLLPRSTQGTVLSRNTGLTSEGYLVNNGSSFILVMEFTDTGPRATSLLTYSGSTDPGSAYFSDQTQLFSSKQLHPVLFDEADILADPSLVTTELELEGGAP